MEWSYMNTHDVFAPGPKMEESLMDRKEEADRG